MKPFISGKKNIFIETTKSSHEHGGIGWEFGTCLWSPTKNKIGARMYEVMKEPVRGDMILHFYEHHWQANLVDIRFCGYSFVSKPVSVIKKEPPKAAAWSGRDAYYRVELEKYTQLEQPFRLERLLKLYELDILTELKENSPQFYPFTFSNGMLKLNQGMYLTRCTRKLFELLANVAAININQETVGDEETVNQEFGETRRMQKERTFFSRNRKLAMLAKQRDNFTCTICGFNFFEKYGELGKDFIECHHLNPLSERSWEEGHAVSKLEDVVSVCSNCHSMIHRKKKAIPPTEIKATLIL